MSDPRGKPPPHMLTVPNPLHEDFTEASAQSSPQQQMTMDGVTVHHPHSSAGTPVSSQQRIDVYLGKTLEGRYIVEALLGEGGMGFVYLGRHKLIDKRVAIKILRSDLAAEAEMTERFLNEAKAASSIGNPHIVDISDYGRLNDGAAFFVMEFLEGPALSELMDQLKVVSVSRLLHIAKQIARGLSAAHQRGIVHRDLKPDNVMLIPRGDDKDFVKILDFGIAKIQGENQRLTRAGSVFGTPHYMSPEQAAGVPVDQRTDIYSLGVILYEMASGKVPFDADNFMGILTQHMYKAPAPIRAIVPQPQDVPPGLEAVVLKALSKKVELRYQTMDELILDLEKVERGTVPNAVPEMMARSGGFNVPADYFRNPKGGQGGAALMPGTPFGPKRKGILFGAIAGAILCMGIIGAILIISSVRTNASANTNASATAMVDPSVGPLPTNGAGAGGGETPPQIVSNKLSAIITTDPIDATIAIDDGKDAPQPQPRAVLVGPDEKVQVKIERAGFITRHETIDGKKIDAKTPSSMRFAFRLKREDNGNGGALAAKTNTPPIKPTGPTPKASTPPSASSAPAKPPPPPPQNCTAEEKDPFTGKCTIKGH